MKMEISIEEKARRYDEAYKKVAVRFGSNVADEIFPELKESEDEKIRKAMIDFFKHERKEGISVIHYGVNIERIIDWLEKQGEQKPADNVEPKFHEGEWVVYKCGEETATLQITRIVGETYVFSDDSTLSVVDEDALRLWDITKDAKVGDVLYTSSTASHETFIFKNIDEKGNIKCYFAYDSEDGFREGKYHFIGRATNCKPATKEQRNILFQKMYEAGYEWDAKKKESKKIEQTSAWSEKDEAKLKSILFHIEDVENKDVIDWFKSLKDRVQQRRNEKTILEKLEEWLGEYVSDLADVSTDILICSFKNYLNGKLQTPLKDRVQLRNKWKESLATADLENSLCDIQDGFSDTSYEYRILGEAIEFIRCTEPKPQWNPSDEQMKALEIAIRWGIQLGTWEESALNSLFNNLKKLKA